MAFAPNDLEREHLANEMFAGALIEIRDLIREWAGRGANSRKDRHCC